MSKHKVLIDGNGSDLINVVGLGYYTPLSRLEDHKRHTMQILQLNEFCQKHGIGKIGDDVHSSVMEHIEKLTAERDSALAKNVELVAMVESLRKLFPLKVLVGCDGHLSYPVSQYNDMVEAFNAGPQQHLRDVRAEAVIEFAKYIDATGELNFGDSNFVLGEAGQYAESVKAGE